jgi:hypothetical protein
MKEKKTMTWTDIENIQRSITQSGHVETDAEKLSYFKKEIIDHLENLQAEEDKKILPFPEENRRRNLMDEQPKIKLELSEDNYPILLKKYSLDKIKEMAIDMALKQYKERPITAGMMYSCLSNLESDRTYLILCVNDKITLERNPFFSKLNGKLVECLPPIPNRHRPFL